MAANEIWVCAGCHNIFNNDKKWVEGGYCVPCSEKDDAVPTDNQTKNWIWYITELRDKEWNHRQLTCQKHKFQKIPKSGMYLGIALWRCIHCEAVTQAS